MRAATEVQKRTLRVMVWRGEAWDMTCSEVVSRLNARAEASFVRSRGTVQDHLHALVKKGMVQVVREELPRRYRITPAGMLQVTL